MAGDQRTPETDKFHFPTMIISGRESSIVVAQVGLSVATRPPVDANILNGRGVDCAPQLRKFRSDRKFGQLRRWTSNSR